MNYKLKWLLMLIISSLFSNTVINGLCREKIEITLSEECNYSRFKETERVITPFGDLM